MKYSRKTAILAHLRRKNIWTINDLYADDQLDLKEVLELFGKWTTVRNLAWHVPEFDVAYLRKLILSFGLVTRRKYQKFRDANKRICPSFKKLNSIIDSSWKKFVRSTIESDSISILVPLFDVTDKNGGKLSRKMFGKGKVPKITVFRKFFTFKELAGLAKMRHKYGKFGRGSKEV